MDVKLLIDVRERAITAYSAILSAVSTMQLQMTTGDYAITVDDRIVAIIERKTLTDYAASFKDGRINNTQKLLAMRAETGCRVIYIVEWEQKSPPKLDSYYGGIKYANIEANMDHMAIRDGIQFITTHNAEETAQRLVRLVKHTATLRPEALPTHAGAAEAIPAAQLTRKIEVDPANILLEMWSCFSGVAVTTAGGFCKISFREFYALSDRRQELQTLLYRLSAEHSRMISTRVCNAIVGSMNDIATMGRILGKVPGISRETATIIVTAVPLAKLSVMTPEEIAQIEYKPGKRINATIAARIESYLNMKI